MLNAKEKRAANQESPLPASCCDTLVYDIGTLKSDSCGTSASYLRNVTSTLKMGSTGTSEKVVRNQQK